MGNGKSSLDNFILGTDGFEVSNDINACIKETIQKIIKLISEWIIKIITMK